MFCDQILGNLGDRTVDEAAIDWLDLTWRDCTRRALRGRTRSGIEIKLSLPVGQTPRHGDILFRGAPSLVAVNLIPTEVLVARPSSIAQMGQLALELGNLHLPVEIAANELITLPDGPTEAILVRMAIPFSSETRQFMLESCCTRSIVFRSDHFLMSNQPSQPA